MAVLALRLRFYALDEASLLKQPVIFSFSRLLQFVAIICGFLWLTNAFIKKRSLLFLALRAYWWTGIVCSWYAIVSYCAVAALHFSAPDIFGAYSNIDGGVRARGLFNEGGPFGIYVVSIFVAGIVRRNTTGRTLGVVNIATLLTALLLSGSKAAFLVAACLAMFLIVSAASFRTRVYYLILAIAIGSGAWVWLDLGNQLGAYLYSYLNMGDEIAARGNDYNLVVGRLSALHIVPKMILAHPVTGIGLGNYPLMRNDPMYLDGLPAVTEIEDLPALGIPGITAEMGVPITIWLVSLLLVPYLRNRREGPIFAMVALFQPLAHTFGVQLNFFYPWFVTACVLGAAAPRREWSVRTSYSAGDE
jgi:hypothetical protein